MLLKSNGVCALVDAPKRDQPYHMYVLSFSTLHLLARYKHETVCGMHEYYIYVLFSFYNEMENIWMFIWFFYFRGIFLFFLFWLLLLNDHDHRAHWLCMCLPVCVAVCFNSCRSFQSEKKNCARLFHMYIAIRFLCVQT